MDTFSERRVALVCHHWGHSSTFFTWNFTKQFLLRRVETEEGVKLDPRDKLFVVKVGKEDSQADRWKVGGPLMPDMDTALRHYTHSEVKLEGGLRHTVPAFLQQQGIDILVVGDQWPQSGLQLSSVSDWVKQNVHCPYLIVRRDAVVNRRMKISSSSAALAQQAQQQQQQPSAASPTAAAGVAAGPDRPGSPQDPGLYRTTSGMQTAAMAGRRIAIAYTSFGMGRGLMQFAKDKVLTRNDTVYICHVFQQQNPMVRETMKLMRAMTLNRDSDAAAAAAEVTRDNSIEFGAAELAGYNLQLNITLQGDPKSSITAFCESEEIDLLIMGSRSGGRIRKKLSGSGVSSHLIDHAPCPCLAVPYKYMGLEEGRDTAEEDGGASPTSPMMASPTAAGAAEAAEDEGGISGARGGAGHSTPSDLLAQLQRQLEEKERVIGDLRQEVQALRLAAAERDAADTHDAAKAGRAV